MQDTYGARVGKLLRRWDPRGLAITPAQGQAALARLRTPAGASAADLEHAQWMCEAAVHPVLEQTLPSAFRVCSFLPVTALLSLAMISTKSATATLLYHWAYQSHTAATRYCNYADTSRPLDPRRMLTAYAASTAAAWGITLSSLAAVARLPKLRLLGLVVPHTAVACAGGVSVYMNSEAELREGIPVLDASGAERGVSVEAARATVGRAVLLHGLLVPGCALLLPVLTMRTLVLPRLRQSAPQALWPAAAALVVGGAAVATPLAAACMPPVVALSADKLEPGLRELRDENGQPLQLFSSRPLY